jgi:hypothetical protein
MPVQMAPKDQGRRLHEGRKLLELFTFAGARVRLAAGRGPISKKAKSPVLHDRALCCFPVQGVSKRGRLFGPSTFRTLGALRSSPSITTPSARSSRSIFSNRGTGPPVFSAIQRANAAG